MKIGFIFECTPAGPDAKVYPYVMQQLCAKMNPVIRTCGNKQNLEELAGDYASILLNDGCQYVFIIWDRMPRWGGSGDCNQHKQIVSQKLLLSNVDTSKVYLCCISNDMESWLIADGRPITSYFQSLSTKQIPYFGDHKDPASQADAKNRIKKYNGRYNDFTDNPKIIQHFTEFRTAAAWNPSFGQYVNTINQLCQ